MVSVDGLHAFLGSLLNTVTMLISILSFSSSSTHCWLSQKTDALAELDHIHRK